MSLSKIRRQYHVFSKCAGFQRLLLGIGLLFAFSINLIAQTPAPVRHVDHIGLREGVSNSEIRCVFQDKKGFLWFGTYDGLNRYDGYDFRVYRNQPGDTTSIIHSYVNCITQDTENNIWIGTRQGVSILNTLTEKFAFAYASRPGKKTFRIKNYIRDVKTDKPGRLFLGTQGDGLVVFEKGARTGKVIPITINGDTRFNYNVSTLLVLPNNLVYVVIGEVGLCRYNVSDGRIQILNNSVTDATCLYADGNSLWVGTTLGLHQYNLQSNTYSNFFSEANGRLKSSRITSLQPMPDGTLWIGTDGGGIQILDKRSGAISFLGAGNDGQTLSSDAVYALLLDREGRKWIGTLRGGINVIDDVKDRFQNVRHDPLNGNSLISNFVKSIFEDHDKNIWIGTDGGGLSIWNRASNRFTNFRHDTHNPASISSNFVTGILQDRAGKMWISTYAGGINRFDRQTHTFKVYRGEDANGNQTRVIFWCLFQDSLGNLWASGLQDGLFLYNPVTDRFKLYDSRLLNILSICEDSAGNLWAGSFQGLYKIGVKQKSFQLFQTGSPVRSLHMAPNNNLWLGTESGLMYFEPAIGKITHQFTTQSGMSNNNVLAIEGDEQGRLWLSTYNGLSRYDPQNRTFTNFYESDGLASKEFNFNASLKLKSGELAFGGINGVTLFYPGKLVPSHNEPAIAFTDIKIDGKPLDSDINHVKANNRNELTAITVPYEKASFAFRYAAIEFTAQERIKYRYLLQGWDREWVDAGHQRNIFFSRLNPGSYILKVNCTDPEGHWLSQELRLNIRVLPPWYATIWAYIIYFLVLAGLVYWFLRNRFRETRLRYEIRLANAETAYQRNLQEKEKEVNERRVEFFTGVSHEFRTPLTLIINPIKDLLSKSDQADRQELNIIYRNSRRLLSLVDQLLLFRKADAVADVLQVAPMDIVLVCREVFLCFVQQAKLSHIEFEIDTPENPLIIYGDREKIEIVLFNLISNAIKYTPNGRAVSVKLSETEEEVMVEVADGGPGIAPEVGRRVFEKFYRSTGKGQQGGFGIGLYLAQQFTQKHHGHLDFQSIAGQGTTFSLSLLKGVNHFPGLVITEASSFTSPLLNELAEKNNQPVDDEKEEAVFNPQNIFTDKKTILVIDDDLEIRKYIRAVLETSYVIYEAENGNAGLTKAREKQPDLIICDVMMPGMNGIELCAMIKQDQQLSYIPMILLTASSSPENKIKGLESGADDYIQKPFEKEVLVARIANLLQIRGNLQQYFYNTITLKSTSVTISDEYKQFLEKCMEIVEKHITNEDFSIKVLAAEIGMSHSNLYRKVKSLSGHTINSFIRYIRLRKAAELLIQSDMNVNEVAFQTGFSSIKYFRAQFFKLFGLNPSDFLKQKRPLFKKRFNVID